MTTILMAAWGAATITGTGMCVLALLRSAPAPGGRSAEHDWFFARWQQ